MDIVETIEYNGLDPQKVKNAMLYIMRDYSDVKNENYVFVMSLLDGFVNEIEEYFEDK